MCFLTFLKQLIQRWSFTKNLIWTVCVYYIYQYPSTDALSPNATFRDCRKMGSFSFIGYGVTNSIKPVFKISVLVCRHVTDKCSLFGHALTLYPFMNIGPKTTGIHFMEALNHHVTNTGAVTKLYKVHERLQFIYTIYLKLDWDV